MTSVDISGVFVVTGSNDNTIKKWDMTTCECCYTYEGEYEDEDEEEEEEEEEEEKEE